ncbi:hypothetical protein B0H10DRAFT_2060299 [Mycena sp. CBHHK59/15]|nr:hypothetical protein B0H10DRAFT_2060299 [Mycena sp. CBHHK59/15]
MAATANPRRTHRKRVSALRLSSDTTSTLPEYIGWRDVIPPPEYEADEDTDDEQSAYVPPTPISPRPRRLQYRRRPSSPSLPDLFLDSLLERSVHALELSNALLQSSMSTPSTSAFREPSPTGPVPVPPSREPWADHLEEITRDVEGLFEDRVSSSLPASTSPMQRPRRRPSFDPGLHYTPQQRTRLVSPPPRALTQYVVSTTDPDAIILPSTLGLRAAPSDWRPSAPLTRTPSIPIVSARAPEPSTPAYNMLSSFVQTPTPVPVRRASSMERTFLSPRIPTSPARKPVSQSPSPSSSRTPKCTATSWPMTPPVEESTPSSSSSSEEDGCRAKLTLLSLRRILDEQPSPPPRPSKRFQPYTPHRAQRPRHLPRLRASRACSRAGGTRSPRPGTSTPSAKRISFAELPESYAGTRPARTSSKRKGKGRNKDGSRAKDGEPEGWLTWLVGASVGNVEDRGERLGVGGRASVWGGGGRAGVDDWAI